MDIQFTFFLIIILFVGLYIYFKKKIAPKIKGGIGELKVLILLKMLSKSEYIILNNILLKIDDSTSQIDHLVISSSGIFVIETKNYKGWIHGHERSNYWKQTIFSKGTKFRNPIMQNKVHVYALSKILSKYPQIKYFPIVVFTGNAVLKNLTIWSPVIYSSQLLRTIRSKNNEQILSRDQIEKIANHLNQIRLKGRKNSLNHIKHVKKKIRHKKENLMSTKCPNCGHFLEKRVGKYGEFYGCSNFPNCKHTERIQKIGI